ncbi:MAG: double-strand break repair helicase AddA [Paracoccaceae bacterium]
MNTPEIRTATAAQHAAARPDISSWITANAGSGKTSVLINRVARILLGGTPPARILCLTYTKAAAAEMQNRLFKQLGTWSMQADDTLRTALGDLGAGMVDATALSNARRLFARALETPGGLKIQTIHAFCESLLRRFPLEAGLSPNFELLDDRAAELLRRDIRDEMAISDELPLLDAMLAQSGQVDEVTKEILKQQDAFEHEPDRAALAAALGISPDLTAETILATAMQGLSDDRIDWISAILTNGTQAEQNAAQMLGQLARNPAETALTAFISGFLSQKGEILVKGIPSVKTKKMPGAEDMVAELGERAFGANQSLNALRALDRGLVLHRFARAFLGRYRAAKTRRQRLEFDDLIRHASALLHRSDMAAWVLYRLDGGIDHILIDEAQDTSLAQWRIFETLADEIMAGLGAQTDRARTLFVVGDIKQSIFSFQGADPAAFFTMQTHLAARLEARETPMQQTSLRHSFRSATPVLALVDAVAAPVAAPGAVGLGGPSVHLPAYPDLPGRVDIHPFVEAPPKPEAAPLFALALTPAHPDPERLLAEQIAEDIAQMIAAKTLLPAKNRPVRAGDFLVLVQRRKVLYKTLIRALKARGVAVAGADRLTLGEDLAVADIIAALKFAACPDDELALATVLRSPLVGWSEAQLFTLAHKRSTRLWASLRAQGAPKLLADLLAKADFQRPYELIELILQTHGGRENLLARLGAESEDALDELLVQALAYEAADIPTLGGFLEWFESGDTVIKRQVDMASDQLRVMSVHGAKGLEAPIVILPDTAARKPPNNPNIIALGDQAVAWGKAAAANPPAVQEKIEASAAAQLGERQRLLYVAMTRAESWLIVYGAGKRGTAQTPCWYDQIAEAAAAMPGAALVGGAITLRHNWAATGQPDDAPKPAPAAPAPPAWFITVAATPPRATPPLSPSELGGAHALPGPDGRMADEALDYGTALHERLEHIIALPHAAQAEAIAALRLDEAAEVEAARLLTSPAMRELRGASPLVEVAFSCNIKGLGDISGRIDLLEISESTVTAYDFKTNRNLPDRPEDTPEALLRQMASYRAALAQIYPTRKIEVAIIWTKTAQIMLLGPDLTDAALARAIAAAPARPPARTAAP